mgnify:CR=1 FL=1
MFEPANEVIRYEVGVGLRNALLGLPVTRREWTVVGAGPAALAARGYRPVPPGDAVYQDPDGHRVRLAVREVPEADGSLSAVRSPDVTIEEDLAHRDLTIHALARDPWGTLVDPYGGEEDLHAGFLRHVTPAYARHPEYLLSTAVAAAELARWGFRIAHGTHGLMKRMAADGAAEGLSPPRRREALEAALAAPRPSELFRVLHRCGALARLAPEVDAWFGEAATHGAPAPEALTALDGDARDPEARRAQLSGLLAERAPGALPGLGLG